jgi:predicted dinucleotide-binding enzyme
MKIAVIGRGNVGGGLADPSEKAGHEAARIGIYRMASPAEL